MKAISVLLIGLFTIFSVYSDNYIEYLETSRKHLEKGDLVRANKCYNIYVQMTGKKDLELERLLKGEPKEDSAVNIEKSSSIRTYTVNGVTFDMVEVKGGTFTMGATLEQGRDAYSNEEPAHQVTLSDYMICKTEVTQELWQAVMGKNRSRFKGDNLPVENVSWNDCQ